MSCETIRRPNTSCRPADVAKRGFASDDDDTPPGLACSALIELARADRCLLEQPPGSLKPGSIRGRRKTQCISGHRSRVDDRVLHPTRHKAIATSSLPTNWLPHRSHWCTMRGHRRIVTAESSLLCKMVRPRSRLHCDGARLWFAVIVAALPLHRSLRVALSSSKTDAQLDRPSLHRAPDRLVRERAARSSSRG